MASQPSTHNRLRSLLCIFQHQNPVKDSAQKGTITQQHIGLNFLGKGKSMFKIVDGDVTFQRIREFTDLKDFSVNDERLPSSICSTHRIQLLKVATEKDLKQQQILKDKLQKTVDFTTLYYPALTRSSGVCSLQDLQNCDCSLCIVGKANIKTLGNQFGKSKLEGKGGKEDRGWNAPPSATAPSKPRPPIPVKVCPNCFIIIHPGVIHPQPCTVKDRRRNLSGEVQKDKILYDQLTSLNIKGKLATENPKGGLVKVGTSAPGKSLTVKMLNPDSVKKELFRPQVTGDSLQKLQVATGSSQNTMKKILRHDLSLIHI